MTVSDDIEDAEPADTRPQKTPRWQRRLRFGARWGVRLVAFALVVPPVSTLMLRDLATGQVPSYRPVRLENVAPVVVQSVIASEDQRFCAHHGVDWAELNGQIERWRAGEDPRGASTITMQVARNLFLWQGRSYVRKAIEIPLALWIDLIVPKKRILEIHLNVAEFGPGLYGIEAAAQHHFGRSADALSRRQAALLITSLPAPANRSAANPSPGHARLADRIAQRGQRMGAYIGCVQG